MASRKIVPARRGAVAIEFALVLPIFLLLVFGVIEVGRMVMVYQILTNGAREGARYAIVPGRTEENTIAVMDDYFDNTTVGAATATISPAPEDADSGDMLTATVSVPFGDVAWSPDWLGWFDYTFSVSVAMRKE
jgi:Flp pilus assembly protein TadG